MELNILNIDQAVVFPNELLEKYTLESTFFSPTHTHFGLATFSQIQDSVHIIRLYQLARSNHDEQYHVVQEMVSFSYQNRQDLDDFLKRLPNMSAIEMLMMLHPSDDSQSLYMN